MLNSRTFFVYPSYVLEFASANPKLPIFLPANPIGNNNSFLYVVSLFLFHGHVHLCCILDFMYKWYMKTCFNNKVWDITEKIFKALEGFELVL